MVTESIAKIYFEDKMEIVCVKHFAQCQAHRKPLQWELISFAQLHSSFWVNFNKRTSKVKENNMNSMGRKVDLLPVTSGLRGPQRYSGSASWPRCLEFPENSRNFLENKRHICKHTMCQQIRLGCSSVVKHLSSSCEALGSISSTTKEKKSQQFVNKE
jgi:hypothetical protein